MLLRCFNQATQCPDVLISDILNGSLDLMGLVTATEALSFINDLSVSIPVIQCQLNHDHALVAEAAIVALRIIAMRTGAPLSLDVRKTLIEIATSSKKPTIRVYAAEALADLQFA